MTKNNLCPICDNRFRWFDHQDNWSNIRKVIISHLKKKSLLCWYTISRGNLHLLRFSNKQNYSTSIFSSAFSVWCLSKPNIQDGNSERNDTEIWTYWLKGLDFRKQSFSKLSPVHCKAGVPRFLGWFCWRCASTNATAASSTASTSSSTTTSAIRLCCWHVEWRSIIGQCSAGFAISTSAHYGAMAISFPFTVSHSLNQIYWSDRDFMQTFNKKIKYQAVLSRLLSALYPLLILDKI